MDLGVALIERKRREQSRPRPAARSTIGCDVCMVLSPVRMRWNDGNIRKPPAASRPNEATASGPSLRASVMTTMPASAIVNATSRKKRGSCPPKRRRRWYCGRLDSGLGVGAEIRDPRPRILSTLIPDQPLLDESLGPVLDLERECAVATVPSRDDPEVEPSQRSRGFRRPTVHRSGRRPRASRRVRRGRMHP